MRLFKPDPAAVEQRARQFHLRADELDRLGKHHQATVERLRAEKYEKAAERVRA